MYSRNVRMGADERYAKNIPPVYGGSRFYRAPPPAEAKAPVRTAHDAGIAVQYEARPKESVPIEAEFAEAAEPSTPPWMEDAVDPACADPCRDACEAEPQIKQTAPPCEESARHGGFLQSLVSGDQEELLLIAILLLLCGESDRAADMIAILILLIIVR